MKQTRLSTRLRSAAAALGVTLSLAGCNGAPETHVVRPPSAAVLARAHLDPVAATAELNGYRAANGLAPVRLDPALNAMAARQAEAMAAAGTISHDVAGSFPSRLAASGVDPVAAAENVGAGYTSFDDALSGWRASPGHNANLLMPGAARFGVALAKSSSGYGTYWSMEMAEDPRPAPTGTAWFGGGPPPIAGPH